METTPQNLAIKRRQLAQEYSQKCQELADLKKKKALKIIELLAEYKTMNRAELYFSATEDGQREIELTMYTKGLLELMRALKSEIDIKQAEAFNQY